jgi:GAF domain-containing protein
VENSAVVQAEFSDRLHQLTTLLQSPTLDASNARQQLLQACLDTLRIQRVGLWRFTDEDLMCCEMLLDKDNGFSEEPLLIDRFSFPGYFAALDQRKIIRAADAFTNPATKELAGPFLKPQNIRSLLDVPIYQGDSLSGIICCEQTVVIKHWTDDEMAFVEAVAALYRSRFL